MIKIDKKNIKLETFEIKNIICLCVDIRKSTSFYERCGSIKLAGEIIDSFISEIYVKLKNFNKAIVSKFVYAGDGIMFIYELIEYYNGSDGMLKIFLDAVEVIEEIIKEYELEYERYEFSAGIGLDLGEIMEINVKEMTNGKGKTPLYVGRPVSRANKLCKMMPFDWKDKIRYTAISSEMLDELQKQKIQTMYELTKTGKRAMKND